MVRRPAAVLAAGVLHFLAAGALPDVGAEAAALAGAVALALCALALLPARDDPVGLAVLAAGAALLAAALAGAGAGAAATPVEALVGAAAGLLFAHAFAIPSAVVGVPLLVAGIDLAALTGRQELAAGGGGDVLALALPRWGGGPPVAQLSLLDATFLAMYAAWAVRFALRPRVTVRLLAAALAATVTLSVATARTVPVLPVLAAAFLLPAAAPLRRVLAGADD